MSYVASGLFAETVTPEQLLGEEESKEEALDAAEQRLAELQARQRGVSNG